MTSTSPNSSGGIRLGRVVVLLAAYILATLVMTWPYVNYADIKEASYIGDARLIIWTLAWDNHAVLTRASLFHTNVFFPAAEALRYNEHLFGLSLFTLPWAVFGASPVLAYNVTWWLAFPLNGLAAYALLRRFVASELPAFAGSLVYAYSFYVMLHAHGHLHLIWIWALPASLLVLERWFDRPSVGRVAAWLMFVLLQALTSWYLAVMAVTANGVMALVLIATSADGRGGALSRGTVPLTAVWRQRLAHIAGATAVAVACLYPFARHYVGLHSSAAEAASYSANAASYLVPPANTVVGRWWLANVDQRPGSIWGEQTLFAGWTALALAAVGLAVLSRGRDVSRRAWVFPLLGLAGFLLSLGPSPSLLGGATLAPFHWLSALPGFDGVRAPARFAVLVTLGIAGLAAIGSSAILRHGGPWGRVLVVAAVPLMLIEWFVVDFPAGKPVPHAVPPIYSTPQVRAARSLVSLPEYRETPEWFLGADYLYYSTAHWRSIVNGFGRTEPAGHAEVVTTVRGFPGTAHEMRDLGVQYVVVHADRYSDGAATMLAAAQSNPAARLVTRIGSDYLFEIIGE